MSLPSGSRVGAYEIQTALGVGGMGEVYKARDAKLGRSVAVKILPEAFALDSERVARFKREAQVLASLNHPNIGQIYGFEDADGVHALVLELVDGPTLGNAAAYDVDASGRFIMVTQPDQRRFARQINIVQNWLEELKQRVPTK